MLRCAERVRELAFHTFSDSIMPYTIGQSVWPLLRAKIGGRPLCPRLELLAWQCHVESPPLEQLFRMLLCPKLFIFISWHPMTERLGENRQDTVVGGTIAYSLRTVLAQSSNLQHLALELRHEEEDLQHTAGCMSLRSLTVVPQHLAVVPIVPSLLRKLALLPRLESIRVSLISTSAQDAMWDTFHAPAERQSRPMVPLQLAPGAFPSLRHISSLSCPASMMADVLEMTSSRKLTSVSMTCDMFSSVDRPQIPSLLVQLCSPHSSRTLREVNLWMRHAGSFGAHALCRLLDVAPQLLELHLVERLSIRFTETEVCISDEDMDQMGTAWPHLVTLSIAYERDSAFRIACDFRPELIELLGRERIAGDHPSIRAVVAFALRCEQLNALTIDVADFTETDIDFLEEQAASVDPQHNLVQLIPRSSSRRHGSLAIPDVRRTADAFHRMFPALRGTYILDMPRGMDSRAMDLNDEDSEMALHKLMCALEQMHPPHRRAQRQMASPSVFPREPYEQMMISRAHVSQ
ncbi:hypothetical protein C8Q76DRAFT_265959 [Earliella scabrosa]|nr:hypothetical protein C8Q76DRAFT_265959 [Earliella scabrosa]